MAERDAASCGSVHASSPPGGVRQHCPSATTSGTRECANARPRAPLMCTARPSRQGGPGANNRRGGAPRGERPTSLDARRPLAPAGLRHWPADGCRCTRAPFGAPLPSRLVRENRKPRRTNASREGRRLHGDRPRMTAPSPRALAMRRNTVRQTTAHRRLAAAQRVHMSGNDRFGPRRAAVNKSDTIAQHRTKGLARRRCHTIRRSSP